MNLRPHTTFVCADQYTVHQLMERLGYTEYVAQGGDWGSAITTEIAMQAPQHCRAIHINFLPTGPPSDKGTRQSRFPVAPPTASVSLLIHRVHPCE